MSQVEVRNTGTGDTYQLTPAQVERFERELSRTAPWRTLPGLIDWFLGRDRYSLPNIAPDAQVFHTSDAGHTREYRIYGRTVLEDVSSRRKRQFYMGLLLVEWVTR